MTVKCLEFNSQKRIRLYSYVGRVSFVAYSILVIFSIEQIHIVMNNNEQMPRRIHRTCSNHTWYEWLTFLSGLFVPLVVGILAIVLPIQQQTLADRQNENSNTIALNNRLQHVEIVHEQQKQIILDGYERDLSKLVFKYESIDFDATPMNTIDENDDDRRLSLIIRMKTLHVMRQLDSERKQRVLQLLIDSRIQHRIDMSHVDLSSLVFHVGLIYDRLKLVRVNARNLSLKSVSLYQSNFSYSNLDESSFYRSNLSSTDFSDASLQRTDWTDADVSHVTFNRTNLFGANITQQQLHTVKSLHGAILPNGSIVLV
jgi:uncharacterized protein YjbI with pentapeptide repeats